jgi:hypothetical protein
MVCPGRVCGSGVLWTVPAQVSIFPHWGAPISPDNYVINTTNLIHTSLSLTFFKVQGLDMFRALLAQIQEAS